MTYLFYGSGNGTTFDLVAIDFNDGQPVIIKGLKVTLDEDTTSSSASPAFVTEAYRVFVDSVRKDGDDLIIVLIFESLTDKTFKISWGDGSYHYETHAWNGAEPYLIDENADRYYLKSQDSAKIIGSFNFWEEVPDLLPGTKLKTQLVFKAAGNGSVFTLGCKEKSPVRDRPVVIKGIKAM